MAVHTGKVIVGTIGTDPRQIALAVDDTTQIVEHLLRLAEPGAIMLSDTTGQLVRGAMRLEGIGPLRGPGTTLPQTAYQEEKCYEDHGNIGDARGYCRHGQSSSGEHAPREL